MPTWSDAQQPGPSEGATPSRGPRARSTAVAPRALPGSARLHWPDAQPSPALVRELVSCQERLRALASQLLRVEERERTRLALDLHDGLSQILVLAKMKLGSLRKAGDPAHAPAVGEVEHLIDEAHQCVRSITFELHPSTFDDLELEAAGRWLAGNVGARYGVPITVEDDGRSKTLEPEHRTVMLRSVRELLINAAKHARARSIQLRMERQSTTVQLTVDDDGIGMMAAGSPGGGLGLASIRECLSQIGGSTYIESWPARGTRVVLRAPWARNASASRSRVTP